jgi:uncharacterized protein (DUF2164 family)
VAYFFVSHAALVFENKETAVSIKLEKETQKQAIDSLQRYFDINMEERIGNLQAAALLDFLLEEIGPSIYNQAVRDAQNHMQHKVQELDIDVHETEFSYWQNQKKRR